MLPMIHLAVLRQMEPHVVHDLMDIWVEFNSDWYRFAGLEGPAVVARLQKTLDEYCVTGFGYSPERFDFVERVMRFVLKVVLDHRATAHCGCPSNGG